VEDSGSTSLENFAIYMPGYKTLHTLHSNHHEKLKWYICGWSRMVVSCAYRVATRYTRYTTLYVVCNPVWLSVGSRVIADL
jgi:hypothetical protein